ncbi:VanZ family protein [Bacillus sp. NEB1478]|uniref:VanZ family protein n=1 Tax=Bacillus sp. NEB1478 TaxID=3073816 RepID=UPI002872FADC|nr:VanZ family protein [Bacillus sp. NEB1478]WNB92473.1 VanZ family protein [Bacillus sp. NEB1478]
MLLPIFYMWFIWLQSSYFNPESIYTLAINVDKRVLLLLGIILEAGHLFEFGILYMLLILMLLSFGLLTHNKEIFCFLIALIYGIIDEFHQIFVPFRSFSLFDLIKNAIGILVVWYIIHRSYFVKIKSKLGRKLKYMSTVINQ